MGNLSFMLEVGAKDATKAGLSSALAGINSFVRSAAKPITIPLKIAQGGLGFLRDINLGLAPLIRGIDGLIESGAALGAIRKSFAGLTKLLPDDADRLASSFVDASNGTLTLKRAMELANRAITSGIDTVRDLPLILDFASKKAVTTGTSFDLASEQLITGLARMSASWLDNFGILNDGLEGVKRTYDEIEGAGAWDALTPAAQKANFIRQSMADIRRQMKNIGVSGKEISFTYAGLKARVTDMVDGLAAAIAGSKGLNAALTGVNTVLKGISDHFAADGTFFELFFGKGQSSGILGIVAGVFEDIGNLITKKITDAIGGVKDSLAELFGFLGDKGAAPTSQPKSQPTAAKKTWLENMKEDPVATTKRTFWASVINYVATSLSPRGFLRPVAPQPGFKTFVDPVRISDEQAEMESDAAALNPFPVTSRRFRTFTKVFSPNRNAQGNTVPPWLIDRMKSNPLTERGEMVMKGQRNLLDRDIRAEEARARRDARRIAAERVREARREGVDLDLENETGKVFKELTEKRIFQGRDGKGTTIKDLHEKRGEAERKIEEYWEMVRRRAGGGSSRPPRPPGWTSDHDSALQMGLTPTPFSKGQGDDSDSRPVASASEKLISLNSSQKTLQETMVGLLGEIAIALSGGSAALAGVGGRTA